MSVSEAPEPTGKRFECGICDPPKGFDTVEELRDHLTSAHQVPAELSCSVCGRVFKSVSSLTGHMKAHAEGRRRKEPVLEEPKSEEEVLADLRLRGPDALRPVLKAKLANLLSIAKVPGSETVSILDQWENDPTIMSDFMNGDMRGLSDLLYFAGLKSQQIEYILIQMARTYNRYAETLSREGYGIRPVTVGYHEDRGGPPPTGRWGVAAAAARGWGPEERAGGGQFGGTPLTRESVELMMRDLTDRVRKEIEASKASQQQTSETLVEVEGPDGRPIKLWGPVDKITSTMTALGLVPPAGKTGPDMGEVIKQAAEDAVRPYKERVEQLLEEKKSMKGDYEKTIEKLEAALKDREKEVREIERTLDNVRDEKNVLYHDKANMEKRVEELKDRIDALEDELKEYRQKYEITQKELSDTRRGEGLSGSLKFADNMVDRGERFLDKRDYFKKIIDFLSGGQAPAPPKPSSRSQELEALAAQGLFVKE